MNLERFKEHSDWVKVWSGKWSLHTCSQFGEEWTVYNKVAEKPVYPVAVYVHRSGITDSWIRQIDKDELGTNLITQVRADAGIAKQIANNLKTQADNVRAFFKENSNTKVTADLYEKYWEKIADYYLPHVCVKYIVDYLSPEELETHLPILEEARLYAETVFREQENFMEYIAEQIAHETGLTKENILSTTKEEMRAYFNGAHLPDKTALEERFIESVQFFDLGQTELYAGEKAKEMEQIILPKLDRDEIKGQIAYKGKAKGKIKIVLDPFKLSGQFNEGDILVTGMTRPEFLPLMEKAAAFITDAGGILSHAAIVAREMKKPCIIGTGIASKTLKDGDLVEVDAEKGIIRILK